MAVTRIDAKRRRTYAGEDMWFPLLEQLGATRLRRAFVLCGVAAQVAPGLAAMIEDQHDLAPFGQDEATRVRYRRMLRDLDPEDVLAAARTIPGQFNQAA